MRKIFLLLLLIPILAIGAELKIDSFTTNSFDISARTNERLDLNGNICALVKVELPIEGCKFEGNVIDSRYDVNEYWVWLTNGTKRFDIKCPGLRRLEVTFADISDIESLTGGATYNLALSGYEALQGLPQQNTDPGANFLVISVEPKNLQGLSVRIDGKPQPIDNQQTSSYLDYGIHTYFVEATGYEPAEGVATVNADGVTTVNVNLKSLMARLSVKSETPGASIAINSQPRGTGSWSGELAPGRYVVEVSKTGYRPYSQTVTLAKRDDRTLEIPALTPVVGMLSVNYKPLGSTITLDGQNVGKTPTVLRDVLVGQHTVSISSDGYEPATRTVTVREGETAFLDGALTLVPENQQPTEAVFAAMKKKYEYVGNFFEGLARVELNGKYGFVDVTGREVIPLKYDDAWPFFEGLANVGINGKYGFIDKTGSVVIPLKYEFAGPFSEGLAYVKLNGKYGFIDKSDRVIIPLKYESAGLFSEGLTEVRLNGKYGFIDKTGREVIPLKYDNAWSFKNGKASVELNGVSGYVDKAGNFTPNK